MGIWPLSTSLIPNFSVSPPPTPECSTTVSFKANISIIIIIISTYFVSSVCQKMPTWHGALYLFPTCLQVQNNECFWLLFFCFADCGGEMAGQEYKRHLLNTLCSSRYVRKEAEILSTVKLVAYRWAWELVPWKVGEGPVQVWGTARRFPWGPCEREPAKGNSTSPTCLERGGTTNRGGRNQCTIAARGWHRLKGEILSWRQSGGDTADRHS